LPAKSKTSSIFGAFVEIGIKESALIHVSEMSDRFVKDPMEVLKVGDVREFRIISIDAARKRIGLSLKSDHQAPRPRHEETRAPEPRRESAHPLGSHSGEAPRPRRRRASQAPRPSAPPSRLAARRRTMV